jgi:branched-chain amino acid transport system substrate-binding protein
MKRKILIPLAILVVIIAAIAIYFTQKPKEPETIKIGAILPLTGNNAVIGKEERDAMEMAINDFQSQEKEIKVEIFFEDFQGIPQKAVTSFQRLVSIVKPTAIFISTSPGVNSVIPLAKNYPNIMFFAITTQKDVVLSNNIYRVWPSVAIETELIIKYLKKFPERKIIIMYPSNELGRDAYSAIKNALGNRVILELPHDLSTIDFKSDLLKITSLKNYQGCILVAWTYPNQTLIILKTIEELKLKFFSIVTSIGTDFPPVLTFLQNSSLEPIFAVPAYDVVRRNINFDRDFQKKYGYVPNWNVASAYDNMRFFLTLLDSCKEELKKGNFICMFEKIKTIEYDGLSGRIKIKENNEADFPMVLVTYKKDMGIVPYE